MILTKKFIPLFLLLFTLIGCNKEDDENNNDDENEFTHNYIPFTDPRDGNTYNTLTIGGQTWMTQNLNYAADSGSWIYNNDENYGEIYGRLYLHEVAKKVCPGGWHLPIYNEWQILMNYLIDNGYNYDGSADENKIAKSLASKDMWAESNVKGSVGNDDYPAKRNASGFSGLPAGYREEDGNYYNLGEASFWWIADSTDLNSTVKLIVLRTENYDVLEYWALENQSFSIRCIKDE
ncbi:MAG: hypothetical protein JXB49_04920 [Bacteroidales bacterium]|nr:hypothetical protein [Bacteroidales bacterium]